jgi:hypothetical protein
MRNHIKCHAFRDDGTGQCDEYEYCISESAYGKATGNQYEKCGIPEREDDDETLDGVEHKPEFWK